jgi:aspartate/methionine/tyrosine aminotransferase
LLQQYFKEMNANYVGEYCGITKPTVMIAKPFWVSYRDIVQLFDGDISYIDTTAASGWKMTVHDLEKAYNHHCKILLLNNGCNPTGALYTKAELANILAFARQHDLYVISDEVYSGLVYDNNTYVSCGSFLEYQDIVCVLQSCSKNFAMTGWRVGFLFAKAEIVQVIIALLSQSTTGVSLVNQHAAYVAIKNSEEIMKDICHQMQIRRDAMMLELRKYFNGFEIEKPHSALYVFVSLKQLGVKTDISDSDFSLQLLNQANVATVPGSAFGVPGYIRISFTATLEDIAVAVSKLAGFCEGLS